LSNYKTHTATTSLVATAKVVSYFTIVIPLFFSLIWLVTKIPCLSGRGTKIQKPSDEQIKVDEIANNVLIPPPTPFASAKKTSTGIIAP
jgi:hypothetical protein